MLLAFLLLASLAEWVPARWSSGDPQSLELIRQTPVNCLLIEERFWSEKFARAAAGQGIATLGVIRPGGDPLEVARRALSSALTGVVLEGDFESETAGRVRQALADSKVLAVELPPRVRIRLDDNIPIAGTCQGVWPGINVQEDGAVKAAPSGGPWIDTNTGFLRFVRAATNAPVWIGNRPPAKSVVTVARYLQVVADAAIVGARWIVALDDDTQNRLLEREPAALDVWRRIGAQLRFYEEHRQWGDLPPHGQLALVEDAASGALLSGGILDMIAVKHTPVRPVPVRRLSDDAMKPARLAVNVDPAALTPEQLQILRRFTRAGGTLLSAPPGWKFPPQRADQITLGKDDIEKLDAIWKEVNSMTGRRNLGARLFNVASMLSNLSATPDGKQVVLQLVNYSDYPVENVTAYVLGKYTQARFYAPGQPPRTLLVYEHEEGAGVDIDKVSVSATLVLE